MRVKHFSYSAAAMLILASASYGADEKQDQASGRVQELAAAASQKVLVEDGLKGAASLKAARQFSGIAEFPLQDRDRAKGGSPVMPEAQRLPEDGSLPAPVVEIKSGAQFLDFSAEHPSNVKRRSFTKLGMDAGRAGVKDATADPRAQMTSPSNGATLSATQKFAWTRGSFVDEYYMRIGSCQGCFDLLDENEGLNLSKTVNLPADGRFIYATLYSYVFGDWYWVDYQYQAATLSPQAAQMVNPVEGSTLNQTQIFTWDSGRYVDSYYLWMGNCFECKDLLDENQGQSLSRTVNLPADGRTIYVTLFSYIQGNWWYNDYQYRAAADIERPVHINITNQLGYAIDLLVNGSSIGSVPAYETRYKDLNLSSLQLSFEVIQPVVGGKSKGDRMSGVFQKYDNPSGTYNFTVSNRIGNGYFFLPLITNQTSVALEIEVNGGLQAENRCGCTAPAYSQRAGSGYYQFFSNSNVRLFRDGSNYTGRYVFFGTDSTGATSPGGPLANFVASDSGFLELKVTSAP